MQFLEDLSLSQQEKQILFPHLKKKTYLRTEQMTQWCGKEEIEISGINFSEYFSKICSAWPLSILLPVRPPLAVSFSCLNLSLSVSSADHVGINSACKNISQQKDVVLFKKDVIQTVSKIETCGSQLQRS